MILHKNNFLKAFLPLPSKHPNTETQFIIKEYILTSFTLT